MFSKVEVSSMRPMIPMLLVLSVVFESFGYWGSSTHGGQRMFDEMAGIVPVLAQILGGLCVSGALALWWRGRTGL